MRPSMMETGLESIAYNINRKNSNLLFFEFGKTYSTTGVGQYEEQPHLALYVTGNISNATWNSKAIQSDLFFLKGIVQQLLQLTNLTGTVFEATENESISLGLSLVHNKKTFGNIGFVQKEKLARFDIKQPVFYADLLWESMVKQAKKQKIVYAEIAKFPPVERDLAIVVEKDLTYEKIEAAIYKAKAGKLIGVHLFDIFESEKLGPNKKSMAINFTFQDEEKTMTEKDIDNNIGKIRQILETDLGAEVRK